MILKTIDGVEIPSGIKMLGPIKRTGIQIRNKLLDGTDHIQVIGDPSGSLSIEVLTDEINASLINYNQAMGIKIRFELGTKYYDCLIDAQPEWTKYSSYHSQATDRHYMTTLNLLIQEEGNL